MAFKPELIEKIRKHYAKIGGDLGALSEFGRDLGLDPRTVHNWSRVRKVIPAVYGEQIEQVTKGLVTNVQVIAEDVAYAKARQQLRIERKNKRVETGRKRMHGSRVAA